MNTQTNNKLPIAINVKKGRGKCKMTEYEEKVYYLNMANKYKKTLEYISEFDFPNANEDELIGYIEHLKQTAEIALKLYK